MSPLNRIQPQGPANAYKTYSIARPMASHWRIVPCEKIECDGYKNGWMTKVDESTELGRNQADYIRHSSDRHFIESKEGPLTMFTFSSGQTCFSSRDEKHRIPLDRNAIFVVQRGDWRQRIGQRFTHATPDSWVNDFGEHQDQLARRQ